MKLSLLAPTFFAVCLTFNVAVAQLAQPDPDAKPATKEEIQARLAEHAKKKAEAAQASAEAEKKAEKPAASDIGAPVAPARESKAQEAAAANEETPATVLPKVEVQKPRITELDRKVDQQNREIAREKQNTKPTKLDETLNSPKISKALAIFGGQSSEDRASIAQERVAMMEDERDLIEAIAQAQTKEEKEELQKTLDAIRAMRRDLELMLR